MACLSPPDGLRFLNAPDTISPGDFPPNKFGALGVDGLDSESSLMVEVVLILETDPSLYKSSIELISLVGDCGIELRMSGLYEESKAMFIDLRCITELSPDVRLGCLSVTPLLLSASASWLLDKVEGLRL